MLKQLNSYDHDLSLRWAVCARYNSPYLYLRKLVFSFGIIWFRLHLDSLCSNYDRTTLYNHT